MKRLYRDLSDQKLAGVCSGIAKYLCVDPTIIRLIWVLAVFFGGCGVLAYIICAIVIPVAPADYYYNSYKDQQQNYDPNYNHNNQNYYDPNRDYTQPNSDRD